MLIFNISTTETEPSRAVSIFYEYSKFLRCFLFENYFFAKSMRNYGFTTHVGIAW